MHRDDPAATISCAFEGGRWLRGYVKGKLTADPVFEVAREAVVRSGLPVTDLGCGLGLFGLWLRVQGIGLPYRGCDLTVWKIEAGRKAAGRLGFEDFQIGAADLCHYPLEGPAVVCAFDILHYLPVAAQSALTQKLALAAIQGSVVLLRTGVRGCGWRTGVTLVEEWWTRCTGWIRGGALNFPSLQELVETFEHAGCRVRFRPLWGNTPFSSHWLEISGPVDSRKD
jgi:hypothetical protein